MKKNYLILPLTLATLILLITSNMTIAQSSKANGANANNRQNNTDFLGWQATSALPGPLQIKNDILGQPITLHTTGTQRMIINPNLTSATTVAAGNQPKNGFHGINTTDPWSRLHILNGTNAICAGYRA